MRSSSNQRAAEFRARRRVARDAHIDRWLIHGMSPDEVQYATGYRMDIIMARVRALGSTLSV